jgi:hypothetical protein
MWKVLRTGESLLVTVCAISFSAYETASPDQAQLFTIQRHSLDTRVGQIAQNALIQCGVDDLMYVRSSSAHRRRSRYRQLSII